MSFLDFLFDFFFDFLMVSLEESEDVKDSESLDESGSLEDESGLLGDEPESLEDESVSLEEFVDESCCCLRLFYRIAIRVSRRRSVVAF